MLGHNLITRGMLSKIKDWQFSVHLFNIKVCFNFHCGVKDGFN